MNSGIYNYPDGSIYQGEWKDGRRHGHGIWTRPDGTVYAGEWENDKPHGQGTLTWPSGKKYIGEWKDGKRHGLGVEIDPDGTKYFGKWENGKLLADSGPQAAYNKQHVEPEKPKREHKDEPVEIKRRQAGIRQQTARSDSPPPRKEQHFTSTETKQYQQKPIRKKVKVWPVLLLLVLLGLVATVFILTGGDETYSGSGRVVNHEGEGIGGVTINFSEDFGATETGEEGYWSKSGLKGEVEVTPYFDNAVFVPVRKELNTTTADIDFQLVSKSITGTTSTSGIFSFKSPIGFAKGHTIDIYVEDVIDNNPLGDIDVEVIVSDNLLEVFAYDSSGQYLPEILVVDLNNIEDYPEVALKDNPALSITIGLLAVAVKSYSLTKFVGGGIAIAKGASLKAVGVTTTGILKMLVTAIAGEALKAAFDYLVEGQRDRDPITVFIFENQEDKDVFATVKVPAGASKEEIIEAVLSVTGEVNVEVLAPVDNPASAYYNDDGTPKFFNVYLTEPKIKIKREMRVISKEVMFDGLSLDYNLFGYDLEGNKVWEKVWANLPVTELSPYSDYCVSENNVYVIVQGTLYKFNLYTGEQLWAVEEVGYSNAPFVDELGRIYCTGYYGPFFLTVINPDGSVRYKHESVIYHGSEYFMPGDVFVKEGRIYVPSYSVEEKKDICIVFDQETGNIIEAINCNIAPIKWDLVSASSILQPDTNMYQPENVVDLLHESQLVYIGDELHEKTHISVNVNTAWVEGVSGPGIGEWIKLESETPQEVRLIVFYNGYQKSADLYNKNNRIKTLRIDFSDCSFLIRELEDRAISSIYLGKFIKTSYLRFTILDVYKGTIYEDTCISGIVTY